MLSESILIALFLAGVVTILLPCILPLAPIVLGASVSGRSAIRPLLVTLGMVVGFVGTTFVFSKVLGASAALADIIRLATYETLFLFGIGFLVDQATLRIACGLLGGLFFLGMGVPSVLLASFFGLMAMVLGPRVASSIQSLGGQLQERVQKTYQTESPLTPFLIGLTMGLVWVPCAGPALGFVFTIVREQQALPALTALLAYGVGASVPLLLIGYGGQRILASARFLQRYTGYVKRGAGLLFIATALALFSNLFTNFQVWFSEQTGFGTLGTRLEENLFPSTSFDSFDSFSSVAVDLPKLPKIVRAPEFQGLGPWHNSEPLTLEGLRGKVVLIDFWTYSCINCIRTLPHVQGYWEKFKDTGMFMLIGVHTPEFAFEKIPENVAAAIKRYELTYPIAQDNDYGTWRAFTNRYWPAKYLIDAQGFVRYTHFGEGAYEETELAIASLLEEIGVSSEKSEAPFDKAQDKLRMQSETERYREQTPEIYLGERSWSALFNSTGDPTMDVVVYEEPEELPLHSYALVGDWQLQDGERQVLRGSEGAIHLRFLGGECNLVLGLTEDAEPVSAEVEVDGQVLRRFTIDHDDLFTLFKGAYGEHDLTLRLHGSGVAGYAFTFGS